MRLSLLLALALLVAPTLTYADTVLVGTNLSAATQGGAVVCPISANCFDYANQFTLSMAVVIDSISVVVTSPGGPFDANGNFTIGLGSQLGVAVTTGIGAGVIPTNPDGMTLNTEEFTFSGLDLSLAAGTYYLGMAGGNLQWDYAPPLSTSVGALGQRFACDPTITVGFCSGPVEWDSLSAPREFAFEIDGTVPVITPEPSTFALLGTGVLGLAGVVRRKFLSPL
jgi:hypothetical protein